jgi:hypothetical protein
MKTLIIVLFLTLFCACGHKKVGEDVQAPPVSVTILLDITDPQKMKLWPNSTAMLQLFGCDKSPSQPCFFKLQAISEVSSNKEYLVHLPNLVETEKHNIGDDIYHRNKTILVFHDSVKALFNQFYKENDTIKSRDYSECWAVISKNLLELTKRVGKKYLVIFSDLADKTTFADVYNKANFNSKGIRKALESTYPMPEKLIDIEVIVVYQPIDREDDARFNRMFLVYKTMLSEHGASVRHIARNENLE